MLNRRHVSCWGARTQIVLLTVLFIAVSTYFLLRNSSQSSIADDKARVRECSEAETSLLLDADTLDALPLTPAAWDKIQLGQVIFSLPLERIDKASSVGNRSVLIEGTNLCVILHDLPYSSVIRDRGSFAERRKVEVTPTPHSLCTNETLQGQELATSVSKKIARHGVIGVTIVETETVKTIITKRHGHHDSSTPVTHVEVFSPQDDTTFTILCSQPNDDDFLLKLLGGIRFVNDAVKTNSMEEAIGLLNRKDNSADESGIKIAK